MKIQLNDTITALATPHGSGAIAIIRLSGKKSFEVTEKIFFDKELKSKKIASEKSHTVHFGLIAEGGVIIDEVLVTIFKNPHSYTGEDSVEISCHGSTYIQQQILQLLLKYGARMANAGEFTLRAFLNGKFDLSQAEAVADLIASNTAASQRAGTAARRAQ